MNDLRPNRSAIGGLHEPAALRPPGRLPWWLLPLLLLALVGLGGLIWSIAGRPQDIADVRLAGDRSPAALDVVLLLDESGSFAGYAAVREETIDRLAEWAPDNLRDSDTITIVSFAGGAARRLATTTVADLSAGAQLSREPVDGDGTEILPALQESLAVLPPTGHDRTLIVVTDTLVTDLGASAAQQLVAELNATSMSVITPAGVGLTQDWRRAFAWERELTADPGSAGSTSLALAEALAHATGQRTERR